MIIRVGLLFGNKSIVLSYGDLLFVSVEMTLGAFATALRSAFVKSGREMIATVKFGF